MPPHGGRGDVPRLLAGPAVARRTRRAAPTLSAPSSGRVLLHKMIDRVLDSLGSFVGIGEPLDRDHVAPPVRRRKPVPYRFGLRVVMERPGQILGDRDLLVVQLSAHPDLLVSDLALPPRGGA